MSDLIKATLDNEPFLVSTMASVGECRAELKSVNDTDMVELHELVIVPETSVAADNLTDLWKETLWDLYTHNENHFQFDGKEYVLGDGDDTAAVWQDEETGYVHIWLRHFKF